MFTSNLRRIASKALMGAVLLGGSTTFVAPRGAAQMPWRNPGPDLPRLIQNALLKIGPERAEAQLAPLRGMSPYDLQAYAQIVTSILRMLPAQAHQAFVNGLFQASPEEEQFARLIMSQVLQGLNGQGPRGLSQMGSTAPPINPDRLRELREGNIEMRDPNLRESEDARWNVWGGQAGYKDPKDPSYRGQVPINQAPSGMLKVWNCNGVTRISEYQPNSGCTLATPLGGR